MPFYRYSGADRTGAPVSGTIEAQTPDDAMLQLVRNGTSVSQLLKAPDQMQAPTRKAVEQVRPAPRPAPIPTSSSPKSDVIRTKPASDKDRMLLFSQLSKLLKAGIAPASAFTDLKLRV